MQLFIYFNRKKNESQTNILVNIYVIEYFDRHVQITKPIYCNSVKGMSKNNVDVF